MHDLSAPMPGLASPILSDPLLPAIANPVLEPSALHALAGFADAALAPLLLLALLETEKQGAIDPVLHRLATTLRELQAAVKDDCTGPGFSGSAIRRLYATVNPPDLLND